MKTHPHPPLASVRLLTPPFLRERRRDHYVTTCKHCRAMAILDSGLHTEERSFHQAGVEDDLCSTSSCSSVSCECTILLPRVHPSIHSFVHSFIHLLFPASLDGFIASFFRSFSFIHSLTHSVTHSLIHSFTHPLIHSLIHSFIFHSLFMTLSLSLPALSSSMRLLSLSAQSQNTES